MFSHTYKDPYAPPLAPKVRIDKPRWQPSWEPYTGRPEWRSECGYLDPDFRRGVILGMTFPCKERDPRWMDPKVPDGTSMVGPMGLDSEYHRNLTRKFDATGDFYDYQKMIRENSSQYKQIAQKWEISKEHPGIAVNPVLDSITRWNSDMLGTSSVIPSMRYYFKPHYGPRFWDKPMNEGCLEKGLALAKIMLPITVIHYLVFPKNPNRGVWVNIEDAVAGWAKTRLVLPTAYSFLFGVTSCTSATIRDTDDAWNWTAASAMVGLAHTTIRNNMTQGVILALIGSLVGCFFQHMRSHDSGLSGKSVNRMFGGAHFASPLSWKNVPIEDINTSHFGVTQFMYPRFGSYSMPN